jgi:hypothetical protein
MDLLHFNEVSDWFSILSECFKLNSAFPLCFRLIQQFVWMFQTGLAAFQWGFRLIQHFVWMFQTELSISIMFQTDSAICLNVSDWTCCISIRFQIDSAFCLNVSEIQRCFSCILRVSAKCWNVISTVSAMLNSSKQCFRYVSVTFQENFSEIFSWGFILPHLKWHGTSAFLVSSEGPPHSAAFYNTRGDVEDLF